MPLKRTHVTIASRVMLPAYPLFAAGVGLSFVATPLDRLTTTPSLAYAEHLVGLRAWGTGFLIVAAALAVALLANSLRAYAFSLAVMTVWMVLYAGMVAVSAIVSTASPSAWIWPAFIAAATWASLLSLLSRET